MKSSPRCWSAVRCLILITSLACGAAARRAQPTEPSPGSGPFLPGVTRGLSEFGAVGNGRADDTAALKRAFEESDHYCLDGGGHSYRVFGTLRVTKSLCLRNATLVQASAPVDTRPYIHRNCATLKDPSALKDCGDPSIPPGTVPPLWRSLTVRTLFIRPGGDKPVEVNLDRVKIDRGGHPEGGSRTDSAGIWLDQADRVDFHNVEITGDGKGYGLLVTNARNVTLNNLWAHDLIWAPYRGDTPLSESRATAVGWNSVPIHEFREAGRGGAGAAKFYGVRIQEQLACVSLQHVQHVRLENTRIERCMARFATRDLPWQADGLDLGGSSSDIQVDRAHIDSTWEGVDVVANGDGIEKLSISDLFVSNSFSFGLKMGYELRDARVTRLNIADAGLSGIVIYGPVRQAWVSNAFIQDIGIVRSATGSYSPWPPGNRAGIRIDEGAGANGTGSFTPSNIILEDITVLGSPASYDFGILNTGGTNIHLVRFRAEQFSRARASGVDGTR
jgi:hypothetical protein